MGLWISAMSAWENNIYISINNWILNICLDGVDDGGLFLWLPVGTLSIISAQIVHWGIGRGTAVIHGFYSVELF